MRPNHFSRKKRQLKVLVTEIENALKHKTVEKELLVLSLTKKLICLGKELQNFLSRIELKKALGSLAFIFGLSLINPLNSQSFEPGILNPFGLTSGENIAFPTIVDLDNDGDLDILIGDYIYGTEEVGLFTYFENIGTASTPVFTSPITSPFGLTTSEEYIFPTFGDLDNDGDADVIATNGNGELIYHPNIGLPTNPQFGSPIDGPFGLAIVETGLASFPELVDIDSDGDLDLFVGSAGYGEYDYFTKLLYFENIGTAASPNFSAAEENPFGFIIENSGDPIFPSFGDIDEDGDMDMIGGEFGGTLQYFENTGDVNNPAFGGSVLNPFGLTSTYYFALPALADMDNDGDVDVIVGEYYANFVYFENNGGVGIGENNSSLVSIHPNPVVDNLRITMTTNEIVEHIEIFDAVGKLVYQTINKDDINLVQLSPGLYSTSIYLASGQKVVKKIVKN